MRIRLTAPVVLAFLIAIPAAGQVSGRQAIERLLSDFETAFNGKDAAKLASLYADDAVLMPPSSPLVKGRTAIDSAIKALVARGGVVKFNPPLSIEVIEDRAVAAGTYTVTVMSVPVSSTVGSQAKPLVLAAKYLTVFKRVGSDWRIAYDMQNADEAAPGR